MEFLEKRAFRQNTIAIIFTLQRICKHWFPDNLAVNIVVQKTVMFPDTLTVNIVAQKTVTLPDNLAVNLVMQKTVKLSDTLTVNIVAQKTVTNENPVLERRKDTGSVPERCRFCRKALPGL